MITCSGRCKSLAVDLGCVGADGMDTGWGEINLHVGLNNRIV